jgi:hypothetical protein
MQNLTPVQEVVQTQTKSKSKVSTKQLCNTIAYCLHPESLECPSDIKLISIRKLKYNKDLRLVRNKDGFLKWVLLGENKELKILRRKQVNSIIACAVAGLSDIEKLIGPKDYDNITEMAILNAPHMDEIAKGVGKEKFILDEETEIKDVRFKSEDGYCYKRLDFDPDPNAPSTLWETDVLPRITHNRELFMAWIGSIFDYKSNKKKYAWLHGGGDSGKSAIATFMMNLLGSAATTCMSDSVNNDFFNQSLVGKRFCAVSEAEPHLVTNANWKALTGERIFKVQQKYEDDRDETLNVKYLVSSNHMPGVPKGAEYSTRIVYVKIDSVNKVDQIEETEVERLLLEGASWFLYHCIEEYKKNHKLYQEFDKYIDMIQEEDFKEEDFKKYFVLDKDSFVTSREIDKILATESRKKSDRDDFKQWLLHTQKCNYERIYVNGVQVRVITGIRKIR